MKILGIHPYGHDASICLIDTNKKTIFAEAIERQTRQKHDQRYIFSTDTNKSILKSADVVVIGNKESRSLQIPLFSASQYLNFNIFYNKGLSPIIKNSLKFLRKLNGKILSTTPQIPVIIGLEKFLKLSSRKQVFSFNHHECHAYSSFLSRPLSWGNKKVLSITIDGQGDEYSAGIYLSDENSSQLTSVSLIGKSKSICLLYAKITQYIGFTPNADEGKLEAWACYSNTDRNSNSLYKLLTRRIKVADLSILIDQGQTKSISDLYPAVINKCSELDKVDVAYAMQTFFEDTYSQLILNAVVKYKVDYLCLAGGGAANVKLNRILFENNNINGIHIFPAMGDDGVAFGASCAYLSQNCQQLDLEFLRDNSPTYWGYSVQNDSLDNIKDLNGRLSISEHADDVILAQKVADAILAGQYGAICRNKAEFGPRALGNRSIIANPYNPDVRDMINLKFKKREWFQPFCPIVLKQDADLILSDWYDNKHMTCAFTARPKFKDLLPAVIHVDSTARAQILEEKDNPFLYSILLKIKEKYGYGVLLNTSFNLHGRAIVRDFNDHSRISQIVSLIF